MKVWSVQRRVIIDTVIAGHTYYPDFEKSEFANRIDNLEQLFSYLLTSFNNVNDSSVQGLVFGFLKERDGYIHEIPSYSAFVELIQRKADVVNSLWDYYLRNPEEYYVVELEYKEEFNPLFIDLNDYQALMPPQVEIQPYTKEDFARLRGLLKVGKTELSIFPSGLIQTHVPWICPENVVSCNPLFAHRPVGEAE